jgi:hypothetical protein
MDTMPFADVETERTRERFRIVEAEVAGLQRDVDTLRATVDEMKIEQRFRAFVRWQVTVGLLAAFVLAGWYTLLSAITD